jgi:hypothetical protein
MTRYVYAHLYITFKETVEAGALPEKASAAKSANEMAVNWRNITA